MVNFIDWSVHRYGQLQLVAYTCIILVCTVLDYDALIVPFTNATFFSNDNSNFNIIKGNNNGNGNVMGLFEK